VGRLPQEERGKVKKIWVSADRKREAKKAELLLSFTTSHREARKGTLIIDDR